MENSIHVAAVEALGFGFDLTSDFRLKFAKSCPDDGGRLVELDETSNKRDIVIPGAAFTIPDVPEAIGCDKGDRVRFKSDVLEFNQMSRLFNQKSSLQGKVPSGYLNSVFDLTGCWLNDKEHTKFLVFDGYFISLCYLHLKASPLILREKVKKAVPSYWDPLSLSRFIETYGTHIIVGMTLGGQDLVCVKQRASSSIPPDELKGYLDDIGDCLFSDGESPLLDIRSRDRKHKVPEVVKRVLKPQSMRFNKVTETSSKDGLTIICSKRGGNVLSKSHSAWLQTVSGSPDAICFKFVPITSLLTGIPGSGYLSHAINLYLRYKPNREDLQCFLEFQVPQQWAPMFCELPLRHERRNTSRFSLQFSFMGPKIFVSSSQVCSEKKPVLGLRLFLEGKKSNGLGIHLQHLSSMPNIMTSRSSYLDPSSTTRKPCQWRGSDDYESSPQFMEPVNWKRYSKVCSTVVKHDPNWIQETSGVFIVTGAQLVCSKSILHLRLLFTHIPNCSIRKTEWVSAPPADSRKANILTNLSTTFTFFTDNNTDAAPKQHKLESLNSGVYPSGPPVPVRSKKFLKYVETAEVVRGPHDTPGHWLVTAAKLVSENGKIGLHVKFALLEY